MFNFLKKKRYTIGQQLAFGKYPQSKNGDSKPIKWRVLDVYNGVALLISEYAIIPSGYCDPNKGLEGIEWVSSLARKVCNDIFYNSAFNESDKKIICKRKIEQINISDPTKTVVCGDNVFILSEDEVVNFMPDLEERKARSSKHVKSESDKVKWCTIDEFIPWWILPQYEIGGTVTEPSGKTYPGMIYPKAVNQKGEIHYHSRNVYHTDFAIRPCIQINLEAYKKL